MSTFAYVVLERQSKQRRINPFDEWFTKHVGIPIRNRTKNANILADCFFRLTFALSDQQLVTGIAMMIAGLRMLAQGTISVYHFSLVRDLAFFSSNAHLLSLIVLWRTFTSNRKYLKKTGKRRRFALTFTTKWRFFCMFVFFVLLIAANWATASRHWDNMYDCPAACVPRGVENFGGTPLAWAIASTYFLVNGYAQWAMQLGEKVLDQEKVVRRKVRVLVAGTEEALRRQLKDYPTMVKLCRAMRLVALSLRFFAFSAATELLTMLGWFAVDTYFTVEDKMAGYQILSDKEWRRENEMGFGQIVPLVLLMLPLMTFLEAYHGELNSPYISESLPSTVLTALENMEELKNPVELDTKGAN